MPRSMTQVTRASTVANGVDPITPRPTWRVEWRSTAGDAGRPVVRLLEAESRAGLAEALDFLGEQALDGELRISPAVGPPAFVDRRRFLSAPVAAEPMAQERSAWARSLVWDSCRRELLSRVQQALADAVVGEVIDRDTEGLLMSLFLAVVPTSWRDRP